MKILKKIVASAFIIMSFPLSVMAYSSHIIAGGQNVGIEINTNGIIVVGLYKVNGKNTSDLKTGDIIKKVNDISVNSILELSKTIDENVDNNTVTITYNRNNSEYTTKLNVAIIDGVYKTGLYVKDSMTGIGTLTYIDPETGIYGALGHEITESSTNKMIEVYSGKIFKSTINSIEKSINGSPGGKNAKFYYDIKYGTITKNTTAGIYGVYEENTENYDLIEVGEPEEIQTGNAMIRTVLAGSTVEEYEINITRVDENTKIKNIHFEITDEILLNKAGGIVQGMSGSPIIQNGKIIGAVTHVIIDDVTTGYGIFITTMLEEGER